MVGGFSHFILTVLRVCTHPCLCKSSCVFNYTIVIAFSSTDDIIHLIFHKTVLRNTFYLTRK